MKGQTVRLFLVDGTPTGLLTAEIMNWTGHVLVAPRSQLADALGRTEASRTGVYCLVGDDPERPSLQRLYVGEGDNVASRLKQHARDDGKDFWTRACIITSKDANLTKAHVRYLENRLLELARVADRAVLANGNEPGTKQLPEADVADMEYFLAQMQLILPTIGFDFLRPKISKITPTTQSGEQRQASTEALELELLDQKYGLRARAIEADGEIVVLAGSEALKDRGSGSANNYKALRNELIGSGKLSLPAGSNTLVFNEDVAFKSPSAAGAVILDRNTNGRTRWRLRSGETLKEWQDRQLASIALPSDD